METDSIFKRSTILFPEFQIQLLFGFDIRLDLLCIEAVSLKIWRTLSSFVQASLKKAKFLLKSFDCQFQQALHRASENLRILWQAKLEKTSSKLTDKQNGWELWEFSLHWQIAILLFVRSNLQNSEQESFFSPVLKGLKGYPGLMAAHLENHLGSRSV